VADGTDRAHLGPCEGTWPTVFGDETLLLHHHAPHPGVFLSVVILGLETAQIAEVVSNLHITVTDAGGAEDAVIECKGGQT
jgi:hypothetical protein